MNMKNFTIQIILAAAIGLAATACKEDNTGAPVPGNSNGLSGVNQWIYGKLGDWYYWNDAVKAAAPPANSLPYDAFLETLLLGLSGAEDTSTTPHTIDGGYNRPGDPSSRYLYSYIERYAASRTPETEMTFGFDVEPFLVSGSGDGRVMLLVRWVLPGGPASDIVRGMWFDKYNGADITYSVSGGSPTGTYVDFWNQLHNPSGTMSLGARDGRVFTLTARDMAINPVLYHDVVTSNGGKKVAYLVYNRFETGKDGVFDEALREVFGEFKSEGATELVLDLRYNPGGYVSSCQLLSSLAARVGSSDIFMKMLRNEGIIPVYKNDTGASIENPEVLHFLDEKNSLGLSRVYVLASEHSASASEAVINSLRGVGIGVVHIGTATEGKNVGMDRLKTTIGGYDYEMWPITFKIMNARNFSNYSSGFVPDYYKNEFYDVIAGNPGATNVIHDFGRNERLFRTALTLIDGGTVTPDPQTRTRALQPVKMPRDPKAGGAKYIPGR